jgi:hypothetical protein
MKDDKIQVQPSPSSGFRRGTHLYSRMQSELYWSSRTYGPTGDPHLRTTKSSVTVLPSSPILSKCRPQNSQKYVTPLTLPVGRLLVAAAADVPFLPF